jgi:hypothetical protein
MGEKGSWVGTVMAIALIGGAVTGIASLVTALISILNGDLAAAGACFIGSALSFGLVARALLED